MVNQPTSPTKEKSTMSRRAASGLMETPGQHQAGKDLSEELEMAPHKEENFLRVKLVGELVKHNAGSH